MDWTASVDGYCERLDATFWAEPLNASTNLAFVLAAAVMAWRLRGARLPLAWALVAVLAAIGVGSFLFHTVAQRWAGLADVLPILLYILVYIYATHRDFWGMGRWPALGMAALFVPYAAALAPVFGLIPGLGSSAGYAPVPLLIFIHAGLLRHRAPATAHGLAIGAGILVVSILFRSLDQPLCAVWPLGTHPVWHLLNAVMLGWMIEVYRRHCLEAAGRGR
ncbi:ceramidase domain-containing protein [Marimonas lutisalis]|uniref:ceramidase domain-containing protein n=1 Tax=Marimonas lutisalis TaxID=2545756 RepID=UPI0010F4CA72|nr:ceramidase domain-containing protein [Marimonas lutisalis]